MYVREESGGAATIERPVTPETEFEGTKPPGGGNKYLGGDDGGDGGGDGNGGSKENGGDNGPNLKPMGASEKFSLQGIFSNYAMGKILSKADYEIH